MRLITFHYQGLQEIGALLNADTKVIRLQAAEQSRAGRPHDHLNSMLTFLQGGSAARDTAQQAFDFAASQKPEGVLVERASVELLSPVPRPESIREFMVFEQHVINCTRRFGMSRRVRTLDNWVDKTFGRKATVAYRANGPWYERPVYYKGNRMSVVGDGARIAIPRYTKAFDWELEFGIFLCKQGRDIPKEKASEFIGGYTIFNDLSAARDLVEDVQLRTTDYPASVREKVKFVLSDLDHMLEDVDRYDGVLLELATTTEANATIEAPYTVTKTDAIEHPRTFGLAYGEYDYGEGYWPTEPINSDETLDEFLPSKDPAPLVAVGT